LEGNKHLDKRAKQEKHFWDKFAPFYDLFMQRFADDYQKLIPMIEAQLKPADIILEIAAGTGQITLKIAPVVKWVTATDISEPMLEVARRKSGAAQIKNIDYKVWDAYTIASGNP
jgi:ubiquinone/menaquinone biosynthesis C-methylase UbiE